MCRLREAATISPFVLQRRSNNCQEGAARVERVRMKVRLQDIETAAGDCIEGLARMLFSAAELMRKHGKRLRICDTQGLSVLLL